MIKARKLALPLFFVAVLCGVISCAHAQQTPADGNTTPSGCDLSGWILQQQAHSTLSPEDPPDQYDTTITVNGSKRLIHLQRNFKIGIFANIPQCRGLAFSPDGVLYATSFNGNIYALPDHDHNGTADSTIQIVTGRQNPHGVAFHEGKMYFSTGKTFERVDSTKPDRSAQKITTLLSGFNTGDHITHTFVFDTVRRKILMQFGSPCNFCPNTDSLASIREYNYDATGQRTFASGLRNAVGMDLDPRTNALWVNVNFGATSSRHNTTPPEGIYLICDGARYGWPYAYSFRMRNPDPAFVTIDTSYIESLSGPIAEVLAHSAPLGLHFYRGSALPKKYHNAVFMSYHGSWNASPPSPPRVTVMWADSDGHNAHVQDFMTGFQLANGGRWGRSVEVTEGPDGALYVSDDAGGLGNTAAGEIYRIWYTGASDAVATEQPKNPSHLRIGIASPNPFNESTTIKYSADAPGPISITLLDLLGKEVRDLSPTGTRINGEGIVKLERGGLTDGVYFLRVMLGSESQTIRIVLAK
jgi:glucose/arabinose dehydrogenase